MHLSNVYLIHCSQILKKSKFDRAVITQCFVYHVDLTSVLFPAAPDCQDTWGFSQRHPERFCRNMGERPLCRNMGEATLSQHARPFCRHMGEPLSLDEECIDRDVYNWAPVPPPV
jgi:hypothetical protein